MRLRVLVVDDLEDTVELACMLIEMMGHDVRGATSGRQALEVAAQHQAQVVICDIGMPDISGYEVARALRRAQPSAPLHLAAITGWGERADRVEALAAGFDQHFLKPTTEAVLRQILDTAAARVRASPPPP